MPLERRQAHAEGAQRFRWSRCHESLLATLGRPERQIHVFNTRHQQVVTAALVDTSPTSLPLLLITALFPNVSRVAWLASEGNAALL